jgi:hypothetical protein
MLGKIVGCLNSRVRPKLLCTSRLTLQLAVTLILDHLLLGFCLCLSSGNCATILQVNVRGFCSGLVSSRILKQMGGGRKLSFGGQTTIWFLNFIRS